jgi:hypothetical protein
MENHKKQCTTNIEKQPCKCKYSCSKEQSSSIEHQEKHNTKGNEKDTKESSAQIKNIRHYHDYYYDSLFYGTTFDRIHFDYMFRRYF